MWQRMWAVGDPAVVAVAVQVGVGNHRTPAGVVDRRAGAWFLHPAANKIMAPLEPVPSLVFHYTHCNENKPRAKGNWFLVLKLACELREIKAC